MSGRFTILRPLGAGGQGHVLAVRDAARDDAEVALKETPRRDADALRREFALLARLRHPNLVAVYDWFERSPVAPPIGADAGAAPAAYTQELVAGQDLWRALHRADHSARERVFEQVLRALAYLHALGVAHLDLKPDNVLVTPGDDGLLARVLDFGIARRIGETVTAVRGSYSYVAPERLAGRGFDQRADLYALGVMMAEVAIGRPPPPEALRGELADAGARRAWLAAEGVPPSWLELVTALCAADPDARPTTAWEAARLWARERGRAVVLHTPASAAAMVRAGAPVGRDAELATCRARLRARGATVLTGPRGVGRATLARAVAHEAQIAGHAVEHWPHSARGRTVRGLGEALTRLLGDPALTGRLFETTSAPRGAPAVVPGREDESARYAAWVAQAAETLASQLLAQPAPPGPAPLLVVHDLDAAPGLARALLLRLVAAAEAGAQLPLSLILCATQHDGAAGLDLGPLDRDAVQQFAAARFGPEVADPRPCAVLAAASGGHPLHLETLAALLVARDVLRFGPGGWVWAGAIDALDLPAEVGAALAERVGVLTAGQRAALGAVVWLRFPAGPEAVAAALALPGPPLEALLELEAAGLAWRDGQGRFRPAHPGIAAALADWAPPGGAAAAHGRVRVRVQREPLAHGWHLGGPEGASIALEVGREAWSERRAETAAEALDLALELAPAQLEALALRAEVADLLGPRELQVACLERLIEALPEADPRALQARSRLFWTLTRVGDTVRAEAAGREVVALARARGAEELLAEALVHLAIIVTQRGDYDESERLLIAAGGHVPAAAPGLRARIANNLGNVLSYREQHEAALSQYTEAYRLKSAEGDPVGQRIAVGNMGLMCLRLGRPAQAMGHFAASWEAARRTGHRRGEAWSLCVFAEVGLEAGAWRFAERRARAALAVATELGDRLIACDSETTLAESLLAQGDLDGALQHARAGLAQARAVESGYTAARAQLLLAALRASESPQAVAAEAEAIAGDARADDVTRARAERLAAELWLEGGALDRAEAAARRAVAVGGRGRQPGVYATAVRVLRACGATREAEALWVAGQAQMGAEGAAWPERPAADGVDAEGGIDGPSRATWAARGDVRTLAELRAVEGPPAAAVTIAAVQHEGTMGRSILACVASCEVPGLEAAIGAWLAGVVEAHGAERAFVVLGAHEVVASRDADGEAVADAERKLPEVAVEQARARGGVWRATGAAGRGALVAWPVTVVEAGSGGPAPVVVLQNRFMAEAFAELVDAAPDSTALAAILRVRGLIVALTETREALARAEEQRHVVTTRSTEELLTLRRELEATREQIGPARSYPNIVFRSTRMKKMLRQVDRVVDTDLPVYVHGESGTGKELVARAIHDLGARGRGPFVAQNVSAIPQTLFESELFGHERGAFTGANRATEGLFRRASGGTLFLDEIGDLPLDQQAKLLRAIETGEIRAVGATRSVVVDVRVVSATHHDLRELVREGRFREDLYYRLNVIRIEIPALRDRPDDIPPLVEHFMAMRRADGGGDVRLGEGVMKALVAYGWPGNVRQLENEVTRAGLLADDGVVQLRDLSPEVAEARGRAGGGGPGGRGAAAAGLAARLGFDRGTLKERVDRLEALVLEEAITRTQNNKSQVSRELGLSRAGLNMKLKRLGLWDGEDE